ncbi:RNA polymerase sigma-70 factor, ECF subfamily [Sinomicrobium oceani]|uniref:RNA polymerase sigma-70 factor, ECF subfamily n=1 Tax=Sinomicrobium oceani TaxID=1150368 RepID=A0A1K1QAN8_9FLAO|nr:sigma-70 family RNA polymerase sigma factor [Sinomicrobium oceani]SFW56777.1 RNA polymerase sigma-70 factor, ECF subfamily [Sinomicrobium oceani]
MKAGKDIEVVWEELRKGSTAALGAVYDGYADILFSYGMRMSGNREKVLDAIHDLFLDLYKYRKTLTSCTNIQSYLVRSLQRKIHQQYKVADKTVFVAHSEAHPSMAAEVIHSAEEEQIVREMHSEKIIRMESSFERLTERQRQALFLKFREEKPYEEIAEIMNISIETSRTLIYRAVKVLRGHLLPCLFILANLFFRR